MATTPAATTLAQSSLDYLLIQLVHHYQSQPNGPPLQVGCIFSVALVATALLPLKAATTIHLTPQFILTNCTPNIYSSTNRSLLNPQAYKQAGSSQTASPSTPLLSSNTQTRSSLSAKSSGWSCLGKTQTTYVPITGGHLYYVTPSSLGQQH